MRRGGALLHFIGFVVCVGGLALDAHGADWFDFPPMPTARQEVGVAALDWDVYVIGGILASTEPTGLVERFDTVAEEWVEVAPLPDDTRLHHVGAAGASSRVWAIGGLDNDFRGVSTLFAFDPGDGEWTRKADLPAPRGASGIAATENEIYLAGGQSGSTSFGDFFVYSIDDDRWDPLPPMPTARNHLAAAIINGRFYAVGGRAGTLRDAFEVYDLSTAPEGEWTALPPLPTARAGIAAAAVHGMLFVFGGEGNPQSPLGIFSEVEYYDLCRNEWMSSEAMPNPRHGIGAGVVEGVIHIPGGSPVQGFSTTDVHDGLLVPEVIPDAAWFLRGDVDGNDELNLTDAIVSLNLQFLIAGESFPCADAADLNDDGEINISDPVFELNFLFLGGPPPPAPGAEVPGMDPTLDDLFCGGSGCTSL